MPKPKVISLFSGAGGLDLGLAAAGFDILFESDIDPFSCETLETNRPKCEKHRVSGFANAYVNQADVRELNGGDVLRTVQMEKYEPDVLAGGPPCQAFSVFGRRKGVNDDRGKLVFEYARLLREIAPRAFVFENVYGLLTVQGGKVFEEIQQLLSEPGAGVRYHVRAERMNAQDYGVPQSRDRVILFGVRSDVTPTSPTIHLPPVTGNPSTIEGCALPWRTVGQAIMEMPSPVSTRGRAMHNHRGRKHGPTVSSRYELLAPGERDGRTRINRLDLERPSYTIVVGSDAGGGKGHVHPVEPRELTPRESARLQTFPDWWEFTGNVRHTIRQVGNAVPPLLGFAIGNGIRESIFSMERVPLQAGVSTLGQAHLFPESRSAA